MKTLYSLIVLTLFAITVSAQSVTVTSIPISDDVTIYYFNWYTPIVHAEFKPEPIREYVPIIVPAYDPIKLIDKSNPTNLNINVMDWMKLANNISTPNVMQFERELNLILFK